MVEQIIHVENARGSQTEQNQNREHSNDGEFRRGRELKNRWGDENDRIERNRTGQRQGDNERNQLI